MSKTVLFIGDAVVPTGFAKMNHAYIYGLQRAGYDVHVLAINYMGDPHTEKFKAYTTHTWATGDAFGMSRMKELINKLRPHVLVVVNDPWNIRAYKEQCGELPIVASVAVDGKNCRGKELNGCAHVVFWTKFGQQEAYEGGYMGTSEVIPLGVDLDTFYPMPKEEARKMLPDECKEAFIIGVVGRNQPRKRIDLAIYYFSEWLKRYAHDDAYMFLHVAPTGDQGYDVLQLAGYFGIANRIIIRSSVAPLGMGIPEEMIRRIYNCFNVMLSCTQGEGWGLCHMEAIACGIPNIVPDWSALGEWPENSVIKVPCSTVACTPNNINVIGGIADMEATIGALETAYTNTKLMEEYAEKGLKLVGRDKFRWDSIGGKFADAVNSVFEPVQF